ncbi:MAG: Hsp70 family protein [bacterium]
MIVDKAIGIDLGTTNSAVAVLDLTDTNLIIAADERGRNTTPSAVAVDPRNGEVLVGREARRRRGTTPEPVLSIKRKMGTAERVRLGQEKVSPVHVSALILREMRRQIETQLTRTYNDVAFEIKRAIITKPAYFGFQQIEQTRDAGMAAELEVVELLEEPTAAAIYYSWKHGLQDATFMVYDLGGGTFDVSIIRRIAGEYQILGVSGDNYLGGDNFDRLLANHILDNLIADGYDLKFDTKNSLQDKLNFEKLVMKAESSKIELSSTDVYQLHAADIFSDRQGQSVTLDMQISDKEFESLIANDIARTILLCGEAMEQAKQKADKDELKIDHILMVGGSSKIPYVQRQLEQAFAARPLLDEPDTCVAFGAALRAATFGTAMTDDSRKVQVFFPKASATSQTTYSLTGEVKALDPAVDLESATVEVVNQVSGEKREEELDADHRFVIDNLALDEEFTNNFTLRVLDQEGQELVHLARNIVQSKTHTSAGGELSRVTTLARPIQLEILRGNQVRKKVLLRRGTSLPCEEKFRLATVDESNEIRFPIYDEHMLLKEVTVKLDPPPAIGTQIDFVIRCDEKYFMTIHGDIQGKNFSAFIEPPPPQKPPTPTDWERLQQEFDDVCQSLPEGEKIVFEARRMRLDRSLKEAFQANDSPMVQSKMGEYRDLVEEIKLQASETLEPPWEEFMNVANACKQLGTLAAQKLPGFKPDEWQQNIQFQIDKGQEAFASKNQQLYSHCHERLLNFYFYLKDQLKPAAPVGQESEPDPGAEAMQVLGQLANDIQKLGQAAQAKNRQDLVERVRELNMTLNQLYQKVPTEPQEVMTQARVIAAELSKIAQQLKIPVDAIGLVQEVNP